MLPEKFIERFNRIVPGVDPLVAFAPKQYASFRVNTLKMQVDQFLDFLRKNSIDAKQWSLYPQAVIIKAGDADIVKQSDFVKSGAVYPQSMQSMLPVIVLDPKNDDKVLDLCAAPGSKTSQIAAHLMGKGEITANEPIRDRFYKLKAVMALTGSVAKLTMVDGRRFQSQGLLFDKVLVDAPCSSEGRFCVNDPKSVGFWSVRKIHEMAHKQKGILLNAARLLKPGGVLVYSTCTYAPEENEAVVDWLIRKDPTMRIVPIDFSDVPRYASVGSWNDIAFDPSVQGCWRVFPDAKCEGFFIAKFIKSDYN